MNKLIWIFWIIISVAMAGFFAYTFVEREDKSTFLIGEASHGHYQIEMACETCHTSPFGGTEVLQNACLNCHQDELKEARDSHPKKKFTDPRNADQLEIIDARYCISCHTEHQQEQTQPMGVTLPDDYCYHCHQNVGDERESHKDLAFDSCASSGCHNFHDNRALYEDFLVENSGQPWLAKIALIAHSDKTGGASQDSRRQPLSDLADLPDFADKLQAYPDIHQQLLAGAHGEQGIGCNGCHTAENKQDWLESPGLQQCQNCHLDEVLGFTAGKHGMRLSEKLAISLTPMTPALSNLDFRSTAQHQELSCNSCHSDHDFNTVTAAADSCLNCHADEHSLAFENSPHGQLWQQETAGQGQSGSGVSCATCHMPRLKEEHFGKTVIRVEHNQNATLRPNEKMIRPVCMQCHSLEFSIDALADPNLIRSNFNGQPSVHVESVDWALKRIAD